jgi:hypothetical protein
MPFTTLTLGGGGSKGILHVGVLLELQNYQKLVFPDGVYGVSVGSIIAVFVAFGIPISRETVEKFKYLFCPSFFVEEIDFPALSQSYQSKGLFSTEKLQKSLHKLFLENGLDLKTALISDAKMPLYILASNLTKGKPTIFSDNVPVIDALRCSCAIPGVFMPQILYGQVYVDGDIFCPSLDHFIPEKHNALCISLKTKMFVNEFIPSKLEEMSPLKYIHDLYSLVSENFHMQTRSDKTLIISYPNLNSMSNLADFDIKNIMKTCSETLNSFLRSKNLL